MRYRAVLFDLLTGLIDSWSLWDHAAGGRDAGRSWRAAYLQITYGCGAYRPYETLVREAAQASGAGAASAEALLRGWDALEPWDDARDFIDALRGRHIGVVTNCSEALGRRAAARVGVPFDVVVTAERAGYYKPHPAPYRLAMEELGVGPREVLFVCGSGFDLFGTAALGLDTWWHNRAALPKPQAAPAPLAEGRTLRQLLPQIG